MLKVTAEVLLVIAFLFFEKLIWEIIVVPIKDFMVDLKVFQKLQVVIEKQNTYATLVIFLVPLAIAEIMGLQSGVMMMTGSMIAGIILYIIKIPVAGLTFWIFSFSKDKLLTIDWFKTLYDLMIRFLDWIKATDIYKSVQVKLTWTKDFIKDLMPENGALVAEFKKIYSNIKDVFAHDEKETKDTGTK